MTTPRPNRLPAMTVVEVMVRVPKGSREYLPSDEEMTVAIANEFEVVPSKVLVTSIGWAGEPRVTTVFDGGRRFEEIVEPPEEFEVRARWTL